jgi:hypothetical protein
MRPVGEALDLERRLDKLRGQFQLRDHPDYRSDIEILPARVDRIAHNSSFVLKSP